MNAALDLSLAAPRSVAHSLTGYAAALLLVSVSSAVGLVIQARWGSSPVDMLYLLPVLVAAIYAGLGPGLVAAAASAMAFNYFFTAPYRTFVIHSPVDVVTVVMLFVVAAVCSQLASSIRQQARLAADHAARNATIAGFARRLLSTRDEVQVAEVAAAQLSRLFDCQVALVEGDDAVRLVASVPTAIEHSPGDLAAAAFALQSGERAGRGVKRASQADWQFHPIIADSGVLGAVGLARDDGTLPVAEERQLLFESLLSQIALALERARLEGAARESAALRARDRLRSALLASIGDEIKPRIKAIQALVRAFRREGTADRSLVADLVCEVNGIERHVDSLLEVGPGDEPEAIPLGDLSIDLHLRAVSRDGEAVHLTPKEFALLSELTRHAGKVLTHSQLLRSVWGPAHEDHVDYLRVAVRALRQKLERDPANPALILNVPGVGYRLALP